MSDRMVKVGDLAIIVRAGNPKNLGKIVKVVAPYVGEYFWDINKRKCHGDQKAGRFMCEAEGSPVVLADRKTKTSLSFLRCPIDARFLKPIRDAGDDVEDEMIQRLGSPFKEYVRVGVHNES